MNINDALSMEHAVYRDLFEQVETLLPGLQTLAEVKVIAILIGRLLKQHGDSEVNLVYAALDHALEDQGRLSCLFQEHRELDERLAAIGKANNLEEARRLFTACLHAARIHFDEEEQRVFPLVEDALQADTLNHLGKAWLAQRGQESGPVFPSMVS